MVTPSECNNTQKFLFSSYILSRVFFPVMLFPPWMKRAGDPVSVLHYQCDLVASRLLRPEEPGSLHSLPLLQHAHCVTLIYQGEEEGEM